MRTLGRCFLEEKSRNLISFSVCVRSCKCVMDKDVSYQLMLTHNTFERKTCFGRAHYKKHYVNVDKRKHMMVGVVKKKIRNILKIRKKVYFQKFILLHEGGHVNLSKSYGKYKWPTSKYFVKIDRHWC